MGAADEDTTMAQVRMFVGVLIFAAAAFGQPAEGLPALADRCRGPLGASLPECRQVPAFLERKAPAPPPANLQRETPLVELPPEPPTEFQKFVLSSTGETLPIFGARLFEKVPSTFAPTDRAPVPAGYVVGPGDELLVRMWGQVTMNQDLTVDRTGSIHLPQAGAIRVAGLAYREMPEFLRSQLGRVYRNFDLNVTLGQLRSVQIFVMGHARRPGAFTVSSLSTLVNALFAAGGPNAQGSLRRIQLRRRGRTVSELDLYQLLLRGDAVGDAALEPGDVLYFPPIGPQVALTGSVKTPAVYELRDENELGDLLELAGGLTPTADPAQTQIERVSGPAGREVLALDGAYRKTVLRDGDLVRVATVTPKFDRVVTLRGHVSTPGRLPWRAGMKLREVVPSLETLIPRRDWERRNQVGYTAPAKRTPGAPGVATPLPAETRPDAASVPINWSHAVIERRSAKDLSVKLVPFHPGRLLLENDERENLPLEAGDVVTFYSQTDLRVPRAEQTRQVKLEGELKGPGTYTPERGETLRQLIARAGGFTSDAYLYGIVFRRESTRREQAIRKQQLLDEYERELARAAQNRQSTLEPADSAAFAAQVEASRQQLEAMRNLEVSGRIVASMTPEGGGLDLLLDQELEDGDSLYVPARPATVTVVGAVYNPNAILHQKDLRVGDYLRRVGGQTRNADWKRAFLVRADGTVVPHQASAVRLARGGFERLPLMPGDALVVPETPLKGSFVRSLRDWSQVFGQLALGAAAVRILQ
jgi:polysaccharide biosynthesis/export protein